MTNKSTYWVLSVVVSTIFIFCATVRGQMQPQSSHAGKINSLVLSTIGKLNQDGITAKNIRQSDVLKRYSSLLTRFDGEGRYGLQLDVSDVSPSLIAKLKNLGGNVVMTLPSSRQVAVYLPIDKIEEAAAMNEIKLISPIVSGVTNTGSVTSEGDSLHHAINVRTDLNVQGDSIKVGVISDGCVHWGLSKGSLDLPSNFDSTHYIFKDNTGTDVSKIGLGDEGTAMMEIVYDLAPHADLYYYGALNDPAGSMAHVDAIYRLVREKHCKVIVDDLTWYNQPMFEDNTDSTAWTVAAAAKWATDTGVVYISSAGNWGTQLAGAGGFLNRFHYQAMYADNNPGMNWKYKPIPAPGSQPGGWPPPVTPGFGPFPLPYADLHDFRSTPPPSYDPGLQVRIAGYSWLYVILEWNDPWKASNDDYDLYLYNRTYTMQKAFSINPQTGTQNPWEMIGYYNEYPWPDTLNIVINHIDTIPPLHEPKLLGMYVSGCTWAEMSSPENSIWGQPGVPSVLAVGAVPYSNDNVIEAYSSHGNYDVYFPGYDSRPKPDVVAVDGGVITGAGGFGYHDPFGKWRFYGTSASAPHVAGMAALLLSKCPHMTPAQVHSKFERTAVELGAPGFDATYGYGRADIERAMLEVDTSVAANGPYSMSSTLNVPTFFATDSGFAVNNMKVTGGASQPTHINSSVTVTSGSPYTSAGLVDLGCPSVKRWYQLTQTGGTNEQFDAQMTAYVDESERSASGVAANNLRLIHWNGSYFDILPQAVAPVQVANTWKIVSTFNNASFSPFFVGYLTRGVLVSTVANNSGANDSTVTVRFSISNTGNGWDTLWFQAVNTKDWTIAPTDSGFSLASGLHFTADIHVTIPSLDTVGTIDTVLLIARSISDPTLRDTSFATVTIVPTSVVMTSSMNRGWNMVSIPLTVASCMKDSLFPGAASVAFTYKNGYVTKDTLKYGSGYWVKFRSPQDIHFCGSVRMEDTITVAHRWNMIGSISYPVDIDSIQLLGGTVVSPYYGYNHGYYPTDSIRPGGAYWIKTNGGGRLVLKIPMPLVSSKKTSTWRQALQKINSISISDAKGGTGTLYFGKSEEVGSIVERAEMPPVPPLASFDARFQSQRFVEGYSSDSKLTRLNINVQTESYPLTLNWKTTDDGLRLWLIVDDHTRQSLEGTSGTLTINSPMRSLAIEIQPALDALVPKKFALEQNYPNPFNPSTVIRYSLPVTSQVTLKVFDVLGREVVTLINEMQESGYKTVELNATSLPSGVYIYRISAGQFTDVKKLILVK